MTLSKPDANFPYHQFLEVKTWQQQAHAVQMVGISAA